MSEVGFNRVPAMPLIWTSRFILGPLFGVLCGTAVIIAGIIYFSPSQDIFIFSAIMWFLGIALIGGSLFSFCLCYGSDERSKSSRRSDTADDHKSSSSSLDKAMEQQQQEHQQCSRMNSSNASQRDEDFRSSQKSVSQPAGNAQRCFYSSQTVDVVELTGCLESSVKTDEADLLDQTNAIMGRQASIKLDSNNPSTEESKE